MSPLIETLAIGSFLLIILSAFVMLGAYVRHAFRGRNAPNRLGRELGLSPAGPSRSERTWRVGERKGRPFALHARVKRSRRVGENSSSVRFFLRIVVGVSRPELSEISVKRAIEHQGSTDGFDTAFDVHPASVNLLRSADKEALRAFVDRSYPRGWMTWKGLMGREKRSLFLLGRAALKPIDMPESFLPEAPAVLIYDHARPNAKSAEILEAIDDLAVLADVIAG